MPGVKEDASASFSLYNATTGTEVSDLFFLNLIKIFKETNFVDTTAPPALQFKTNITDPFSSTNIKFTYIIVVIKEFYV